MNYQRSRAKYFGCNTTFSGSIRGSFLQRGGKEDLGGFCMYLERIGLFEKSTCIFLFSLTSSELDCLLMELFFVMAFFQSKKPLE